MPAGRPARQSPEEARKRRIRLTNERSRVQADQRKMQRTAKKIVDLDEDMMEVFKRAFAIVGTDWVEHKATAEAFAALLKPTEVETIYFEH
jgi:hypothetical protein